MNSGEKTITFTADEQLVNLLIGLSVVDQASLQEVVVSALKTAVKQRMDSPDFAAESAAATSRIHAIDQVV